MKWKIFEFDQKHIDMQALLEKFLKHRYKLTARISGILKEIKDFELSKIRVTFVPSLPADTSSVAANAKNLYGVASDETMFSMLQTVTDVNAKTEMERIKAQQESSNLLPRRPEMNSRLSDKDLNGDDNDKQVLEEED